MTITDSQAEEKPAALPKRKWTGLAKWLLIGNLVFGGIGVFAAEPGELILMLPTYISLWGIYWFKRWGFYGFAATHTWMFLQCLLFLSRVLPPSEANADVLYNALFVLFIGILELVVASLIVRSRWKDMDPPFWEKRPVEGQ